MSESPKIPVPPVASADEIGEALSVLKRFRKALEEKQLTAPLRKWIGDCLVRDAEGGA